MSTRNLADTLMIASKNKMKMGCACVSTYVGCGSVSAAVFGALRAPSLSRLTLLPRYSGILLAAQQSRLSLIRKLSKPMENPFYGERLFPFIMGILNSTSFPIL